MKIYRLQLESMSPYSQGRPYLTEKLEKEQHEDYDIRTWRDKAHVDNNNFIFIPSMQFKNCLSEVAKYLSIKIPGGGNAKYTKHFEAGVLILEGINTGIKKEEALCDKVFGDSHGKSGGGSRVWKRFPMLLNWKGDLDITVLDEIITEDILLYHMEQAGKFIGVGRWRPRKGGMYGRFRVLGIKEV